MGVKGLNASNLFLRYFIKITCMNILFFFNIASNSNFSTKFYILSLYLGFTVLAITDLFKDFLYW